MSLEFEFSSFKDAMSFGKNVSRNLKSSSKSERRGNKHFIIIPEKNLNTLSATALAVSIGVAGLMTGSQQLDEHKFNLVVDAMQRANPALAELSDPEIGAYLSGLSHDQLQGVMSNTKGVYHEMLYVDGINSSDIGETASLHPELNNPGVDVIVSSSDNDVMNEVQLKATDSTSYVNEHLDKYPDIALLATSEVASKLEGVDDSGITNAELNSDVTQSIAELKSVADSSTQVTEEVTTSVVSDEITGLGPISIITGLLFGIF